ncbi:unnamed protein product [Porites evermanni]|uniref:UMOD/GP2/OIT3-like D8C domain-containing protein n=1 Tax=Porites evermanni TaxID=104178 RepID=A0ABN8S7P7_9CNID|nr:unnamed protein product [Porites evermanni]
MLRYMLFLFIATSPIVILPRSLTGVQGSSLPNYHEEKNMYQSYWKDTKIKEVDEDAKISAKECYHYTFLNESSRANSFYNISIDFLCDDDLNGWYRFGGDAGKQMADSCVPEFRCGAELPGWLNGSHPERAEGVVRRKVCFRYKNNCCEYSTSITVRNCGGFYVYHLGKPPICNFRYCGNGTLKPRFSYQIGKVDVSKTRQEWSRNSSKCEAPTHCTLSRCTDVTFHREFVGLRTVHVFVSLNHEENSSMAHTPSALWAESINTVGFKLCSRTAGNKNDTGIINWLAFEDQPSTGITQGSVALGGIWTTETKCEKVAFFQVRS